MRNVKNGDGKSVGDIDLSPALMEKWTAWAIQPVACAGGGEGTPVLRGGGPPEPDPAG